MPTGWWKKKMDTHGSYIQKTAVRVCMCVGKFDCCLWFVCGSWIHSDQTNNHYQVIQAVPLFDPPKGSFLTVGPVTPITRSTGQLDGSIWLASRRNSGRILAEVRSARQRSHISAQLIRWLLPPFWFLKLCRKSASNASACSFIQFGIPKNTSIDELRGL